jgi:hypothetical protein
MITVYLREVSNASRVSMFYAKEFNRMGPDGYLVLFGVKDMDKNAMLFIPESNIAYYVVS